MKRFKIRLRPVDITQVNDRTLLLNLYFTQGLTLIIGLVLLFIQGRNPLALFTPFGEADVWIWGVGFAAAVLLADVLLSRWIPEELTDDGGINVRIFRRRPIWHIAVIAAVAGVCEEVLFRGALQYWWGPYWTSIFFAAIHVRYLRHWLMTGLVFLTSYGLGWIYLHTGSLWTPVAAHFIIDLCMGCILKYRRES